jgi:molybdopterin molybdotransferase
MTIAALRHGPARTPTVGDMTWAQAHRIAGEVPTPLPAGPVPLAAAAGLVLAAPIRALIAGPMFDTAAMDGYAISGPGPWHVIGQTRAGGQPWTTPLDAGEAVEIATGAQVPPGTRAVIPYEHAHCDGYTVPAVEPAKTHFRRTGEDTAAGDILTTAGRPISATVLGAAAQAGLDTVTAVRRPRVRLIVTGDEIITRGVPAIGQVRDALSPIVAAIADRAGGAVIDFRILPDGASMLAAALQGDVDVIAVTGSSSVGIHDHLHGVLAAVGATWHIDGVRCRPGHPQSLARTPAGTWIVGLPGNPYAGLAGALTILEPVVLALSGRPPAHHPRLPVAGRARPRSDDTVLAPVRIRDGEAVVIASARPGNLRTVAAADALAVLTPAWRRGHPATLIPIP